MDDNRKKALSAALGQIEKQFGKGSVMRLGDAIAARDIEAVMFERVIDRLRAALPELVAAALREHLAPDED